MMGTLITYICLIMIMIMIVVLLNTFLGYSRRNRSLPYNWPLVGMLPELIPNFHRLHDKSVEILESCGGAFKLKNHWFAEFDTLLTSNPADVHHIICASFSKYPKGIDWRKRFVAFRDSFLNADFEEWKYNRRFSKGLLTHQRFHELIPKIFEDGMQKNLIPFLEHATKQEEPVALQNFLGKHLFYIACRTIAGCDPDSFHTGSHEKLFSKAIAEASEAVIFRYFLPESVWKLQKWLGTGKEKRLSDALITLDDLVAEYISAKQKEQSNRLYKEDEDFNALELLLNKDKLAGPLSESYNVIRGNVLTLIFAAYDTSGTALNWFFWVLSKHPVVEKRIREEIQQFLPKNGERKWLDFGAEELNKMVYLHAALCETLRLYPPVPFQSRTPLQKDTLPSGHKVNQRTVILISIYAMGRMRSIWGEDCHEFKPERWITDDGEIRHEPAHKFFAFLAGPRICPGKDMAFTLMKATVSAILHNYDIQVVANQQIIPIPSILLHMNRDLMVTVKKRLSA